MKYRGWLAVGAVVAVIGLLVGAFGVAYGNFSVRGYIEDTYKRSPSDDIGDDAKAYSSTKSASQVADEISSAWRPADRYVDGSGVYLRYDDDAVVIRPAAIGSLILVERLATAYPRYAGVVGGYWGWNRGATVRGGGPGAGK